MKQQQQQQHTNRFATSSHASLPLSPLLCPPQTYYFNLSRSLPDVTNVIVSGYPVVGSSGVAIPNQLMLPGFAALGGPLASTYQLNFTYVIGEVSLTPTFSVGGSVTVDDGIIGSGAQVPPSTPSRRFALPIGITYFHVVSTQVRTRHTHR